jgi:hypothetical protein
MDKKSVKYLQGIKVSELTLAERIGFKNLGRETPGSVIS